MRLSNLKLTSYSSYKASPNPETGLAVSIHATSHWKLAQETIALNTEIIRVGPILRAARGE